MRCQATDLYPLPSSRQLLADGALAAPAKIGRTGIQVYSARELGLDGGSKPIRLMRTAEEVAKAVASFESRTVTDDHPLRDVDPSTWKLVAKGDVRDVAMSGDYMASTIIVRDGQTIDKVREGKAELSCGYAFDLDMTPGVDANGISFDGYQRNIAGNHVAIVDYGRAGSQVRIADRDPNRSKPMKTARIQTKDHKISDKLTVAGTTVNIEGDDAVIASVQDLADRHDRAMKDCKDAYDSKHAEMLIHKERADAAEKAMRDSAKADENEADDPDDDDEELGANKKKAGDRLARIKAKLDAKMAAKDAEIAALKIKASDAETEKRAELRAKVIGDAKKILGEDFEAKGKSIDQIRIAGLDAALKDDGLKATVVAVLGETEPSKAKAEDVATAFRAVLAAPAKRSAGDSQDPVLSRILAGGDSADLSGSPRMSARDAHFAREAERSRQPAARGTTYERGGDLSAVEDR